MIHFVIVSFSDTDSSLPFTSILMCWYSRRSFIEINEKFNTNINSNLNPINSNVQVTIISEMEWLQQVLKGMINWLIDYVWVQGLTVPIHLRLN